MRRKVSEEKKVLREELALVRGHSHANMRGRILEEKKKVFNF